MRNVIKRVFWLGFFCLVLPYGVEGVETSPISNQPLTIHQFTNNCAVRGIYGVPSIAERHPLSYVGELERAGVNAVFVPADKETVVWFKERGFQVYVSVNAFGGKGGWKTYPDSRPVTADGSFLGSRPGYRGHGGVCPTHPGWRNERLKHIERIAKESGASGIWLDFIRYPGLWEATEPEIPDTCYCPRCLDKFQRDKKVEMPGRLSAKDAALWIKGNCLYQWMKWKKEQIASFVFEARDVMEKNRGKKPLKLGLFLVPWTKGERGDAISYLLAQDPFQLSALADVISPMVYHKMCGRSAEWVGYMCRYYSETAKCLLWPIVQSVDCVPEEFGNAVRFAGQGGADGILAFAFRDMKPNTWAGFRVFELLPNLIANPGFKVREGSADPPAIARHERADYTDERLRGTESEKVRGSVGGSRITNNKPYGIAVTAKDEWGEEWVVPLAACEAGAEYVFKGEFWRDGWRNRVYPSVSLWGEEFLLDTHLKAKVFQPIRVNVPCPSEIPDPYFRFINRNRNTTFWLTRPSLKRNYRFKPEPAISIEKWFFQGRFFPIGVYGADLENLGQIKKLAINTVLLAGSGEDLKRKINRCHEIGLRYVLSVPHDPDQIPVFLNEIAAYVRPHDLAFYVNDEPGIWSFPVNRADDINRLIKDRFPGSATCMAVVRPQVCRDFQWAADFFMLDQYPVPYMPMTWLSDCMDACGERMAHGAGGAWRRGRLAAVIQAFGGERYADVGWPRLPTWQEMDCLAFLSVVHGSRGVFFYTYGIMGQTEEGREKLGRVVGRLNRIYPWLIEENLDQPIKVEMMSSNRVDPKGRAAVHCCLKKKGNEMLLIAVNTIGTYVEAVLGAEGEAHSAKGRAHSGKGMAHSAESMGHSAKGREHSAERKGHGAKREVDGSRITNQQITNNSAKRIAREVFSGEDYVVVDGKIRVRFGPYGVKAFLFRIAQGAERKAHGAERIAERG